MGIIQVFLRQAVYDPLELKVREVLKKYAVTIQKAYRGFIARKSLICLFLSI